MRGVISPEGLLRVVPGVVKCYPSRANPLRNSAWFGRRMSTAFWRSCFIGFSSKDGGSFFRNRDVIASFSFFAPSPSPFFEIIFFFPEYPCASITSGLPDAARTGAIITLALRQPKTRVFSRVLAYEAHWRFQLIDKT